MQLLERNKREIKYKTYGNAQTLRTDSDGYYTGEYKQTYSSLKTIRAYMTANRGDANEEMFGKELDYDNVIYAPLSCDIDEFSILWIGADATKEPSDYKVLRVATSLNHKAIAIKKVR